VCTVDPRPLEIAWHSLCECGDQITVWKGWLVLVTLSGLGYTSGHQIVAVEDLPPSPLLADHKVQEDGRVELIHPS